MAEATVVGRTRVSLTPDTSKFGDLLKVELPKAIRPGAIAAGDLAGEIITGKVQKAVAKMRPVIKVGIDLDTAPAKAKLDKLTAARKVQVSVDLDTTAATTKLDKLTVPRTVKVAVEVDTTAGKTKVDRLIVDRTVRVTATLDDQRARVALDSLTADRTVKITASLDETTAKTKLQGILGQRTVDILPTIQQAAYNRAKQQLDKLCADRVVNIRASVDTRVGAAEIRNLTQRRQVRIGIDVDTRVAADSLANLTRRRQMTIQARADTAAADTALRFASRDRTTNIRVRTLGLGALTAGLGSLGSSGSSSSSGLMSLGATVLKWTAIIATSLPTVASFTSALAQMGPLAATAVPAVAMLGGAFAAVKVGISGVGDAVKAAFQPAADEASKAASATKAVETAQRSLARAQRSLSDAQVQAAERVKQAQQQVGTSERELTAAQRDARQAQLDLTAARQQATRDLEDMNNSLKDARLSEESATLAVQQAELDLQRVRSDPTATQLQIQQAELAKQQAVQSLEEQRLATQRLEKDTAAANKAGVDGSKTMVDARQKVADANQQVADRERALAQAQADVAKAQADGQRQIADAQEAVADAARSLADAQQTAASQTSKLDDALAKLSPNARAFVGTLQDMAPAWRSMKLDVQDTLFAGLGSRLSQVGGQILPTVRKGLTGAASELNLMGKNALTAVSNLQKTGQLKSVFDGVKQSLGNLSRVPGQMVTGFAQLSIAAQPAFDRMTKGAANVMDRVMEQLSAKLKDGSLTKSINTALDVAIQFGKVLGNVGGIIGGIFKAASAAGGDFFGVIGAALAEINRIIKMPEVQKALTAVFRALNAVAGLLAGALGAAIQALLPLLATLAPVVVQIAHTLGPVVAQLFAQLGKALMPVIQALLPVISTVVATVANLVVMLLPLLQPIGNLIAAIITAVAPFLPMIGNILQIVVTALVQVLTPVINALIPVVVLIGGLLARLAPLFPPIMTALMPLLPPLGQLTIALLNLAMQVLTPLMPLIVILAQLLTTVLAKAVSYLVPIVSTVIGWFTKFVNAVTVAVKWVVDKFKWLFDVLLGHSIIPDIVRGTIDWFSRLWTKIKQIVGWIVSGIVDRFTDIKNGATRIWNSFWNTIKSVASGAWDTIRKGFDSFADTFRGAFRDLRDGIGTVWNGLKKLAAAPIRFFIDTVYNNGLVKVWNATAGKIPGIPDMAKMAMPKGLARGGILPGWSTWRDGDDQLVPMRRGEGVYVSEVMRDPYERARLHALNAAAIRGTHPAAARAQFGFAEGGILGGIKSIGSSIADGVGSVLKKGEGAVRGGLADVAEKAFKPIKAGVTKALGANPRTWPGAVAQAPLNLIDKAIDYIRGKDIPEASGQWIKPVNVPYGTRFGVKGAMWSSGRHTGLDFPAATGTKVVAVDNGTVDKVQTGGPYGKHVTISHGGGLSSLYAHMSAMVAKAGASIRQGARVGSVGATGNVTGPHLHLEARINGKPVDPMPYLTGGGDGGSGVQRWRGVVQQALGEVHQSLSLVNTTLRRMNQESGGNPTAVNRYDSNWKAGHPSVGLLQVIEETFRRFAGKYRNTGPFMYGVSTNPMANVYASMKYALATYGSLSRAYNRPGGYSLGGIVNIHRGQPRGYAAGGVIKVGGKRIDTGPIAASVGADFLKQLAGTAAAIDSAMSKVATAITAAFKGVKTTLDDRLIATIKAQTSKLDALAKQRDAIAAKITAANQLAADATGQAVQYTALTSLPNGGTVFDAGGILAGLNTRLAQLKKFGSNLTTLAKRGLNKTLLQQIITAGPESGAAYAQALVDATPAQLTQINAAQSAITKATGAFGKDAADAMYDAGADSGKGYLAGLASTQKAIEAQMAKIAKAVQKSIKVELQIKSPSRILRALGRFTGLGYAQGVEDTVPQAQAAAARMAGTVRATATATTASIRNQQTINQGGDRHLHYSATVREVPTRKSILDALAIDDMLHRTAVVGV
ncbi:peptidoglycan DD-metalloendopeptidase family protein [Streptomyces sp. PD-S100-1]|uniref:peptidoglycan DD-metalloendopeptidase family protein n=1 Tax=Streptomyces sp. PD-S100-1 TaxID=3394351 RepID=UPI0039BC5E48